MQPQRNSSGVEAEFKSPGKRQRRGAGGNPTTAQQPSPSAPSQQQSPEAAPTGFQEAEGSNEGTLAAATAAAAAGTGPAAATGEPAATVTDAAKAFRELRVRPGRAASPLRAAGGGGEPRERERDRAGGLPERPPSPKKRKASYNIDKEFILKDDKVKRNTDTQGDISQARGQLGQLLFEFSQIELNRDLLEAIKRNESKTGRASGRPPAPGQLDRAAFELAVADATELLQAQLSSLEAHCQEPGLRSAILRSYAVQAIATFADEESSSGDDDEASPGGTSSDDENADSNSRRQRTGSSSQDGPSCGAQGRQGGALSGSAGSQDGMGAAAACEPRAGRRGRTDWLPAHAGSSGGAATASPSRQAAVSTAEQASSSFLPDAPPDSALEDTASAGRREQPAVGQQHQQRQQQRSGLLLGRRQLDDGDGMQQRMRMLSLEAEGSVQPQSSAAGGDEEDGPTDMIRSPAPVTSRRMPLPPALPVASGAAGQAPDMRQQDSGLRRTPLPLQLATAEEEAFEGGAGSRRASPARDGEARMAAALKEARQLVLGASSFGQHRQQPRRPAQQEQEDQQAQQESSEGGSGGQASSAAPEPPKRQRRSGDLLPPVFEHSAQQQRATEPRRASDPGAAAAAAATAEQRAAILGSIVLQPSGQLQQQQQPVGVGAPAAGDPAGGAAAGVQQPGAAPEGEAGVGQQSAEDGLASDATLRQGLRRAAHSGSSVWGSTLVCADLTVNDVASQYWPFLRSAMQGQAARLQESDKALVVQLVKRLGETITDTYKAAAHSGRRPASEVCSLIAATAFDEYFRHTAAESSGASL